MCMPTQLEQEVNLSANLSQKPIKSHKWRSRANNGLSLSSRKPRSSQVSHVALTLIKAMRTSTSSLNSSHKVAKGNFSQMRFKSKKPDIRSIYELSATKGRTDENLIDRLLATADK